MRAFLGIELDQPWLDALTEVRTAIRDQCPEWRQAKWVAAQNLHVTLQFLGQIDTVTADGIVHRLAEGLSRIEPFDLILDEVVHAVPSPLRAKMLWATLSDMDGSAAELATLAQRVAVSYGIETDTREYRPHITLARARRPTPIDLSQHGRAEIDRITTIPSSVSVRHATLFKSTLTRQGPVYEILARVPLG